MTIWSIIISIGIITWYVDLRSNKFIQITYLIDGRRGGESFTVYNVDNDWNIISTALCVYPPYNEGTVFTNIPNGKALIVYHIGSDVDGPLDNGGVLFYILGQTNGGLSYGYDNAGNRTSKTIEIDLNMASLRAAPSEIQEEAPIYKETIEYSSGIEKQATEILIYPNPTQGLFAVEIQNMPEETPGEIYLYRSSGQTIEKRNIGKNNRAEFDISRESPGVYFVNIHLGDKVSSWKIIKK